MLNSIETAKLATEIEKAQIAAFSAVLSAFVIAIIGTIGAALISYGIQKRRNSQDKESQWRGHAVELTKLEIERIKSRGNPSQRPSILTFLAHYRDLQELNSISPAELYQKIRSKRINAKSDGPQVLVSGEERAVVKCGGVTPEGHPVIFLTVRPGTTSTCPYCSQKYALPIS